MNLVSSGENKRLWESVGYISSGGVTNLKTVLWPGNTIFSPASKATKTYR
jgi:hypothetical protein